MSGLPVAEQSNAQPRTIARANTKAQPVPTAATLTELRAVAGQRPIRSDAVNRYQEVFVMGAGLGFMAGALVVMSTVAFLALIVLRKRQSPTEQDYTEGEP